MFQFLVMLIALSIFVVIVAALIFWAFVMLAMACAIGIPLWFLGRHLMRHQLAPRAQSPIERLQNLYVDGRIDLFEFERRVARLVAYDR